MRPRHVTARFDDDWAATMPSAPLSLRLRFPSTAHTATLNWTIASTAVPLNGMLQAINRDETTPNGHERDGYRDGAEQATDATYRCAEAP